MSPTPAPLPVLLLRIGTLLGALPLRDVVETLRPLATSPVAEMPSFVRGVSVVRGTPIPVVDAAALLAQTEPAPARRWVTVRAGSRRLALAVQEVVGTATLEAHALHALPPLAARASADVIQALGQRDRELLVLLESGRCLPETVWPRLEAAAGHP